MTNLAGVGSALLVLGLLSSCHKAGQRPARLDVAALGSAQDALELPSTQLLRPSVDSKVGGYFLASSEQGRGPGGFGGSSNPPRPAPGAGVMVTSFDASALALEIVPEPAVFKARYAGVKIRLSNRWSSPVAFYAQDSRLSIIHEALDDAGQWKEIEYLPNSFCGNSYHQVVLGAGEAWDFVAPRYDGSKKTLLRVKLLAGTALEWQDKAARQELVQPLRLPAIYSRPYWGAVNPGQFQAKQGQSILDPYDS